MKSLKIVPNWQYATEIQCAVLQNPHVSTEVKQRAINRLQVLAKFVDDLNEIEPMTAEQMNATLAAWGINLTVMHIVRFGRIEYGRYAADCLCADDDAREVTVYLKVAKTLEATVRKEVEGFDEWEDC